jgi:hypothetical protein
VKTTWALGESGLKRRQAKAGRTKAERERNVRAWSSQDENMAYEEARESQTPTYEDLEAQAEAFMKAQSAIETGESEDPGISLNVTDEYGTAEVTDEEVELYTAEIMDLLELLVKRRDMTLNEVKLILAIEDPRAQEARRVYGIEDESGVSREEITQCFVDVVEKKKKINNRIALRELRKELMNWPGLLEEEGSLQKAEEAAERKDLVVDELAKPAANPKIGREDEADSGLPKGLVDYLPDWMGYGVLYSFSIVPILITVVAIGILWVNSFSN